MSRSTRIVLALLVILSAGGRGAMAAGRAAWAAGNAAVPTDAIAPDGSVPDLQWRLLGPLRAGWSTCALGAPGRPAEFYFGGADGGVFKSTDAGRTWTPVFDVAGASSIGALAVAPSNPDILYAGTGQVETRYDIMDGRGVFRTADGGRTWTHAGLGDTRHIGAILVDPRDPDVVLVAALGHVFGPHPERGVFRTTDGGRTWDRTLFVDDGTGAVDLAFDPAQPEIVFAALWQLRLEPWLSYFKPTVGPGSGIWRSADGGRTWTRLEGHGLPAEPLGRIGLAVAPGSGGARVYATIDDGGGRTAAGAGAGAAAGSSGSGLYRSDDSGATWTRASDEAWIANSYFSRLAVEPGRPDTVYVMGQSVRRSDDGGRTYTITRGAPGGDDFHFIWIDPADPRRVILASDQGTIVTQNGGATWSSWYNQPTGQFYHLAADDRFPYWVYSSQQDSGTAAVASRSDYGQLTFRDWHPVGGDERDFSLPDPADPDSVFVSGLGGTLTRFDARTGRVENVSPWPVNSYARRPTTVRYRYGWITPIAFSPIAPHALYQGAQVLFRSNDRGRTWETISPDLTGAVPGTRGCDGDVPRERARACGYGSIHAIAPSPRERDQVWVGTNSGLVQLTRDGGRTWRDVTPPDLEDWSVVSIIDASPADAATAYVAVDRHRLDDFAPRLYRTHDFGSTWTRIDATLPGDGYALTIRQDLVEPRLLFAGTRAGVFVSLDDGGRWQPLRQGLPATAINDLLVHGDDLIAATQGRAIWALDDISPLRALAHATGGAGAGGEAIAAPYLFPPATAMRVRASMNRDTPLPPEEPTTPNPPAGVAIDYDLGPAPSGPVALEILDAAGTVLRRFASDEVPARPEAERYFEEEWLRPPAALPSGPGMHRVHWDLRGPRPRAIEYDFSMQAVRGVDVPIVPQGLMVAPGRYQVRLTAGGRVSTRTLTVAPDPRARLDAADLAAQAALYRVVAEHLARATEAHERIEAVAQRLADLSKVPAPGTAAARKARDAARRFADDMAASRREHPDDTIDALGRVLSGLATDLEPSDAAPTAPQREVAAEYGRRLEAAIARWEALRDDRLPVLNDLLARAGLTPIAGSR